VNLLLMIKKKKNACDNLKLWRESFLEGIGTSWGQTFVRPDFWDGKGGCLRSCPTFSTLQRWDIVGCFSLSERFRHRGNGAEGGQNCEQCGTCHRADTEFSGHGD
jgi:hypothetical protein